jgi:hypothetical protein
VGAQHAQREHVVDLDHERLAADLERLAARGRRIHAAAGRRVFDRPVGHARLVEEAQQSSVHRFVHGPQCATIVDNMLRSPFQPLPRR